ncbi:GGDEF domain-containing protein [Gilvimarinus agarilyticus]|uniref:GGDEF domain-containing protein n=1 Tax=unclassified Gilvimarinus TaxID=2642066 RepID=UPI001C08BEB7|nr:MULTISPECIES: GGDEF domain-containing protein [unclassified Gilvimarinus]MBU2884227.1 GGDEF domain-containing protein [Gilvimarinus agarilyticus]MDO6569366.1 GGDEF domain-containing protein [Gilvimarinus sp. 2_MG-2023]MDO6747520.1 GGDEF domain-containing protein [Gilvimarinus sp. 1_MG-2023]
MIVHFNRQQWLLLGALILTLAAILLRSYLPERQLNLLTSDQVVYLYYDQTHGGGSKAEWVERDAFSFRCKRENPNLPSSYCGMSIELTPREGNITDGIDFSQYDSILLDVDVDSTQPRISLILRNFNPDYSTVGDFSSTQHISLPLRVSDLQQSIAINMSEFSVSEWWLVDRDVSRQHTRPDFGNVITFGVDVRDNLDMSEHRVTLNQFTLTGEIVQAETWYLAILVIWLCALVVYLLYSAIYWRQQARGGVGRIKKMAQRQRELRSEAANFKALSEQDPLSGLANRLGLQSTFNQMAISDIGPVSFILIDIDHFKRINDRRGHAEGDRIICAISDILQNNTRSGDLLARWGGEEYLLIAPYTDIAQAQIIAEKIRLRIYATDFFAEKPMPISVSVGISKMRDQDSFDDAFNRADACLYQAKAMGRNCAVTEDEL